MWQRSKGIRGRETANEKPAEKTTSDCVYSLGGSYNVNFDQANSLGPIKMGSSEEEVHVCV